MTYSHSPNVGILILEEGIDISVLSFLSLATEKIEHLNLIKVDWISGRSSSSFEEGVVIVWDQYAKQPLLHLLDIPPTMTRDFLVNDLNLPIKISGIVVLVNVEQWITFTQQLKEEGRVRKPTDPKISDLAWAKSHGIPVVIGAFHARAIDGDIDKLSELLAQPISVPVIWCNGEIDEGFVDQTLQTVYEEIQK